MAIQALIINSLEKSGKFKLKLRYIKKAQANIDRLDDALVDYKGEDATKSLVGKKYIEDLFKSYSDIGIFGGINFVKVEKEPSDSSAISSGERDIVSKKDALEAKLDAIVNIDTTKP